MSTQNEFEDWRDRHDHLTKAAFEDAYSLGAAPLLSRIAEMESRIDALSKDADPVAWISTVQCIGQDYGKELYGKLPVQSLQAGYYKHTPLYLGKQSSIDASISAREGEA